MRCLLPFSLGCCFDLFLICLVMQSDASLTVTIRAMEVKTYLVTFA